MPVKGWGAICLVLLLAGCTGPTSQPSGSADTGLDEGDAPATDAGPNDTADPEPTPGEQELLNRSLSFPYLDQGQNEETTFEVPEDSRWLRIQYQAVSHCEPTPVVHASEARLVLESPNGTVGEHLISSQLPGDDGVTGCQEPMEEQRFPIEALEDSSQPGEWTVGTSGEFNGHIEVWVIADPEDA